MVNGYDMGQGKRRVLGLGLMVTCAVVLLMCGGCKSNRVGDELRPTDLPQVIVRGHVRDLVQVSRPLLTGLPDQAVRVSATVASLSDDRVAIEYHMEFFDSGGRLMQPVMDWVQLSLPVGGRTVITGQSHAGPVGNWRLVIRDVPEP
jgi:uncharacterized protein YcfL